MAVTATVLSSNAPALDQRHLPYFTIQGVGNLGTLYQTGGMDLTRAILKAAVDTKYSSSIPSFTSTLSIQCGLSANGLVMFDWIPATGLIQARTLGTTATAVAGTASVPLVIARATEALAVAGHTAALAHTPLAFESCLITAGGVTGACNVRTTAAANSLDCYFNVAGPSVNFLAADAVTACSVSYCWVQTAAVANTLTVLTPGTDPAEVALNFDLSAVGYNFDFVATVA